MSFLLRGQQGVEGVNTAAVDQIFQGGVQGLRIDSPSGLALHPVDNHFLGLLVSEQSLLKELAGQGLSVRDLTSERHVLEEGLGSFSQEPLQDGLEA